MGRSKVLCVLVVLAVVFVCGGYGFAAEEGNPQETKNTEGAPLEKKEEAKVTGSGSIGFFNKYIFRGYELSRGSVVISLSPSGISTTIQSTPKRRRRFFSGLPLTSSANPP